MHRTRERAGVPTRPGSPVGRLVHSVLLGSATLLLAAVVSPPAVALDDGLARTPPMGWSSWNHFGCDVDEWAVRATADAMARSGMRAVGYRYVNVDDCWMASERDARGRVQADPVRFPSGIAALADYVHRRGLRLGIYHDIGERTCSGRPGMAGHEADDVRQLVAWRIDYLKLDFCHVQPEVRRTPAPAYARVRDLVRRSGRRVVLGICNWGVGAPWRWGPRVGHLWRVTGDIKNEWSSVMRVADRAERLWRFAGPGGWNDPDSLEIGNGVLTKREGRAQLSVWAMLAAPLIAGNDVRALSRATRATLTNREVISVDQDGAGQGRRVRRGANEGWVRRLRSGDRALLLLNRRPRAAPVRVNLRHVLAMQSKPPYQLRDLWAHRWRRSGPSLSIRLSGHGAAMFRFRR